MQGAARDFGRYFGRVYCSQSVLHHLAIGCFFFRFGTFVKTRLFPSVSVTIMGYSYRYAKLCISIEGGFQKVYFFISSLFFHIKNIVFKKSGILARGGRL
jgi:hypothetical protein